MASNRKPFYVSSDDAPAKQRILVVALELFVRNGLCETSIRDIAEASGFTNPALFKHFASKNALAEYLFERCYLEMFQVISAAVRTGETFSEKQAAVIEAYLAALDRDRDSVLYVQEELRYFWPRMSAEVRKQSIVGEIRALLQTGNQEGAVTGTLDVNLLSTAWIGTLQQFARAKYFGEFRQSSRLLAGSLNTLLSRIVSV